MPIMGLTDTLVLRRDGKIRAGMKDENTGYPKNMPHFLLHDAPQLIPILGDKPTEIYFTVSSDQLSQFFRDDLRLYTKNQLVCKSMHGYKNPATGQDMGAVAAYFKVGQEVQGLTTNSFPGISRSFERKCAYKACPDYLNPNGGCSEHLFLDMVIPQYSMGALFTLDSSSINAVLNCMSAFQKAYFRYQGKFSGQIFKLCKKKVPINFPDKNGNLSKRDTDVVHVDNVTFAEYERMFKDTIDPIDWEALLFWRNTDTGTGRALLPSRTTPQATNRALMPPGWTPAYEVEDPDVEAAQASMPPPPQNALAKSASDSGADAILARANDPTVAPLFQEIALLLGKDNNQEVRVATAKQFPDLQRLITYLKGRIRDMKKVKAPQGTKIASKAAQSPPASPPPAPPATSPQAPPPPTSDPLNSEPLY